MQQSIYVCYGRGYDVYKKGSFFRIYGEKKVKRKRWLVLEKMMYETIKRKVYSILQYMNCCRYLTSFQNKPKNTMMNNNNNNNNNHKLIITSNPLIHSSMQGGGVSAAPIIMIQAVITWNDLEEGHDIELEEKAIMSRQGELIIVKAYIIMTIEKAHKVVKVPICIKMRAPLSAHNKELDTYHAMTKHGGVSRAFAPILCAFEFKMMDTGVMWGGFCMPYIEHTLCSIMSVSPKPSAAIDMNRLAMRFAESQEQTQNNDNKSDEEDEQHHSTTTTMMLRGHGVPLRDGSSSFEMALLSACFRLLMMLHRSGWVHGDTHLGNFMLDTVSWRVCLIDSERSFRSTEPTQYLLDTQETFGHATGLLLAMTERSSWDMSDIWGVMVQMHPAVCSTGPALCNFMPVCTCFVYDDQEERERGCRMCSSRFNKKQALMYMKMGPEWFLRTTQHDFDALSYKIKVCRQESRDKLKAFIASMAQHLPVIKRHIMAQQQQSGGVVEPDMVKFNLHIVRVFSLTNTSRIMSWLTFVLYKGILVRGGHKQAVSLARTLAQCKLISLSKFVSSLTMVYQPPNHVAVV